MESPRPGGRRDWILQKGLRALGQEDCVSTGLKILQGDILTQRPKPIGGAMTTGQGRLERPPEIDPPPPPGVLQHQSSTEELRPAEGLTARQPMDW